MFITSASPQDVIFWFKNADHGQEILCFLLANEDSIIDESGDSKSGRLVSLIRNYSSADVSLGDRIALLMFHAQASRLLELTDPIGSRKLISAEDLLASKTNITIPLRDTPLFKDVSEDTFARRILLSNEASESTLRLDAEFIRIFGINPRSLPAICCFIKGVDDVVIKSLKEEWTGKDVRNYFLELQTFLIQLTEIPLPPPMGGAKQAYGHLIDLVSSIEANKKKLNTVMSALAKKAALAGSELQMVNRFIEEENGTTSAVKQLFSRLQSINFLIPTFEERRLKCLRLAGKVDNALDLLHAYHVDRLNESEELWREREDKRREALIKFAKKLSANHKTTDFGISRKVPVGFWTALARAKDLMDIAKHFSDCLKP